MHAAVTAFSQNAGSISLFDPENVSISLAPALPNIRRIGSAQRRTGAC